MPRSASPSSSSTEWTASSTSFSHLSCHCITHLCQCFCLSHRHLHHNDHCTPLLRHPIGNGAQQSNIIIHQHQTHNTQHATVCIQQQNPSAAAQYLAQQRNIIIIIIIIKLFEFGFFNLAISRLSGGIRADSTSIIGSPEKRKLGHIVGCSNIILRNIDDYIIILNIFDYKNHINNREMRDTDIRQKKNIKVERKPKHHSQ